MMNYFYKISSASKAFILVIFALFLFFFVHISILKNDAYVVARQYLFFDNNIFNKYGKINDIDLSFFGSRLKETAVSGDAALHINLSSENGQYELLVKLIKIDGKWAVVSVSNIDGR